MKQDDRTVSQYEANCASISGMIFGFLLGVLCCGTALAVYLVNKYGL